MPTCPSLRARSWPSALSPVCGSAQRERGVSPGPGGRLSGWRASGSPGWVRDLPRPGAPVLWLRVPCGQRHASARESSRALLSDRHSPFAWASSLLADRISARASFRSSLISPFIFATVVAFAAPAVALFAVLFAVLPEAFRVAAAFFAAADLAGFTTDVFALPAAVSVPAMYPSRARTRPATLMRILRAR